MICIISDTHENLAAVPEAVARMKALNPELVIHCGDIISPPVLKQFEGLPLRAVFGNNDGERAGLQRIAAACGFAALADELELEVRGKRFYVYHGAKPEKLAQAAMSGEYDYVLTGHTHTVRDERIGKARIINPGSLFMSPPHTFATLDPETDSLEIIEVKA